MTRETTVRDCPHCKTAKEVRVIPEYVGFSVSCSGCYDADCVGDPPRYVTDSYMAFAKTEEAAVEEWNSHETWIWS